MDSPKPIKLWIQPDGVPTFYQRGAEPRKFLVGNPKLSRGKKPANAVYLLTAISALRAHGDPLEILLPNFVTVEQINVLLGAIEDSLGRPGVKNKADGWRRFFFGDDPLSWYLEPQSDYCPLLANFSEQQEIEVKVEGSDQPLSKEQLISTIKHLLGVGAPESFQLELLVVDVNGHSRKIDNGTFAGFIRLNESVRIFVRSNFPTHFCCFWIDPNSRILKLHPNIEEEKDCSEYRDEYYRHDSGSRTVITPSNNMLDVPDSSGIANLIVLGNPRRFEAADIEKIRDRISILVSNYNFHTGSVGWGCFESPLVEIIQPMIERVRRPMGLLPKTSLSTWKNEIVNQMNGFASKVSVLYIPQNPFQ
jgi:hypothetical protein